MLWGRAVLAALLAASLVLGCRPKGGDENQGAKAKRVILVVCDTLRADRLGCYGNTRGTSPCLDAFAASGSVYENAYAQSSMTMPSMAALLTGRPVDEIGVGGGNRYHLAESVTTLAEVAQRSGLATGAVVSNFVLREPKHDALATRGIAQGFDHYDDEMDSKEANRRLRERVAPDTTAAALRWVDETVAAGRDDFFLLTHFIDPHGPYTPPEEYVERFAQEHADATLLSFGDREVGPDEIPAYQVLGEEARAEVYVDRYEAEVAYVDEWIGALLDGLSERGLLEEALVVFTSDHGESLGEESAWFTHGFSLHRSNIHVPLLIRFPSGSGSVPGTRVATAVQHLDVSATILDALGTRLQGDPRNSLFDPLPGGDGLAIQQLGRVGGWRRWVGVATDRWHFVGGEGREPQLYDLAVDPGARKNVAPSNAGVVDDLVVRYEEMIGAVAMPKVEGLIRKKEKRSVEEGLKALGYGGDE